MIEFSIDKGSGVPAYLQIQQQVKHAVLIGLLERGQQLPTVRQVVESAGINPNTVLKAYRELELGGYVEIRQGQGTYVSRQMRTTVSQSELARVRRLLRRTVEAAIDSGMSVTDLMELLTHEASERRDVG